MAHPETCHGTARAVACRIAQAAALAILMAACTPPPASQTAASLPPAPADFPEGHYRQAETLGRKVLRVDPGESLVAIVVRRAGPLAGLGHDHVVASRDVRGYIDIEAGRADLYIPLARLTVDEPGLRAEAKLDTLPSQEAVEGTRRNMHEKVLDTGRYPYALISATRMSADPMRLSVAVTLHGATRRFEVPVQIEAAKDGIAASGRLTFNQTDFAIAPYAVLGGALQVQDQLGLRFRISAKGG